MDTLVIVCGALGAVAIVLLVILAIISKHPPEGL